MEESSRRVVYQPEETAQMTPLPADEKNPRENRDDPHPLPARNMFLEEESRKSDGDRSVQRTKNADHRDLLHFHSQIAQHESASIKHTHAQHHPAHFAA